MGFSRQKYWSVLPFPSPGDLPDLGIKPGSPALKAILYRLSFEGSHKWGVTWNRDRTSSAEGWKLESESSFSLQWAVMLAKKKKNAVMLAKMRGRTIQAWSGGSWVPNVQRWRRRWQPTPVLLCGKSHGWRSLVGYSPRGREESGTTERLHFDFSLPCIGEGYDNLFQDSCLENPRDRGAWWAAIYGVAQSWTRLKRLSSSNVQSNLGRRASFFF